MKDKDLCQEISLPKEINVEFNKLINHLREIWGPGKIKQKDLAALAGVNPGSLSKFIKHGTIPSFENLYKLIYAHFRRPPIYFADDYHKILKAINQIKSILSDLS